MPERPPSSVSGIPEDSGIQPTDEVGIEPVTEGVDEHLMVNRLLDREVEDLLTTIEEKRSLAGSTEEEIEEIRSVIIGISETTGVPLADVVTSMLDGNPKADGLTTVIARIYPDRPDVVVTAYMNGVNGRSRSMALSAYSSKLSDRGDLEGLEAMYDLVPPSQDRAEVARRYVKAVAINQGLTDALAVLEGLDLMEERRYSVMGLYPYIRDNRTTLTKAGLDQFFRLAREFGMEKSARASTGVGN